MDEATLTRLLDDVRSGAVDPDDAVVRLRRLPFADLGIARIDHHRALRQGLPEAVYGPGKATDHVVAIVGELLAAGTADLPVADECAAVLAAHGVEPQRLTDVGVAGVHRLLGHVDDLAGADAVVVRPRADIAAIAPALLAAHRDLHPGVKVWTEPAGEQQPPPRADDIVALLRDLIAGSP